jgi:transposase
MNTVLPLRLRPVTARRRCRFKVLEFFAGLPPCLVGMEACGSAHHWGRELIKLGHQIRLIPARHVRPYIKGSRSYAGGRRLLPV